MTGKFDERQLWIRGNVFKHTFIVMGGLLIVNAFLAGENIVWADGFQSSVLILMAAVVSGSVEAIFKGAFFSRNSGRWAVAASVMGLCAVYLLISAALRAAGGERAAANGALTDNGFAFVMGLLFLAESANFWIKTALDKKNKRQP